VRGVEGVITRTHRASNAFLRLLLLHKSQASTAGSRRRKSEEGRSASGSHGRSEREDTWSHITVKLRFVFYKDIGRSEVDVSRWSIGML
jgi:hypothetical protein